MQKKNQIVLFKKKTMSWVVVGMQGISAKTLSMLKPRKAKINLPLLCKEQLSTKNLWFAGQATTVSQALLPFARLRPHGGCSRRPAAHPEAVGAHGRDGP